jgi:hypothetical protein
MSQSVLVISTDYRATRDLGVRECGSVFFPTVRSRQWQQATASPPAGSQANNTSVTSQNCESVEPESEATHITSPPTHNDSRTQRPQEFELHRQQTGVIGITQNRKSVRQLCQPDCPKAPLWSRSATSAAAPLRAAGTAAANAAAVGGGSVERNIGFRRYPREALDHGRRMHDRESNQGE